ncbi:hypothetical protein OESDEN_24616 [Oesophagostomum dentatum]|uniref:Uncharacterized protein n=1 Tax=Oesophagostomum dentatum TaxID=61180 RepID=A0A0B1RRT9_OESDE|nr:hypothetical protein OESDEN_24616 [Oesophagostomum dentatum]
MLFEVPVDHFPVQRAERPHRPQILLRIPQISLIQRQEVSAAVEPKSPSVCRSQFNFCSASTSSTPRVTRKAISESLSVPVEGRRYSCPSVRPQNSRPSTQPSTPSRLFQRSPLHEQFRRLFSSALSLQQLA